MTFEVSVDGRPARLTVEGNRFRYEREGETPIEREFSVQPLDRGAYSVLIGGRGYEVIVSGREVRVNGRALALELFDPRAMRSRQGAGAGAGPQKIAATMPGKVVRVLVAKGDEVEAGQGLVVVEAMKMQNEMKSPKAGRVAEVRVRADATVTAGEVLVVIE